jgi:ubiquinone/menaquinone biosynthesis C-methylase UbiE
MVGNVDMQWHGTVLPRIRSFLPATSNLEIACGHGRWTQFLQQHCERLIGVDLSSQCVRGCERRFMQMPNLAFFQQDGKSLGRVPEESVAFIFSFDSLVHADYEVLRAYLNQFKRMLKPDGTAFIHHSNNGECAPYHPRRIPRLRGLLRLIRVLEFQHLRDLTVSVSNFAQLAHKQGLACISQEINAWLTIRALIDCFSTLVRSDSVRVRGNVVIRNGDFFKEVCGWSRMSGLHC